MARWFLAHIGLAKPYRFERTLAVLAALMLAAVAGAVTTHYYLADDVAFGTRRWWYFVYVAALIALGVICARMPRIAAVVLSVAALEIGLGLGSAVLFGHRLVPSDLLPRDRERAHAVWHPLLQAVSRPTLPGEKTRGNYSFNAQGLRGRERSAEELRGKEIIALFGGSTTEDIAVPEGLSWGEQLERTLGADRVAVLNHGVTMYATAQILLQTAFYQSPYGIQPTCAIYYVGGVDIQNSHIRGLDPGYADYQAPSLVDGLEVRRLDGDGLFFFSPTLRYLNRLAVLAFDTVRPAAPPRGEISADPDPAFEAIYVRNVRSISAINRQRGIRTLWIGEIMDRARLIDEPGGTHTWAPFIPEEGLWALMSRLNGILRQEAAMLGDTYIEVPIDDFQSDDFSDPSHFVAKGSLKFATRLAPEIAAACRRP